MMMFDLVLLMRAASAALPLLGIMRSRISASLGGSAAEAGEPFPLNQDADSLADRPLPEGTAS